MSVDGNMAGRTGCPCPQDLVRTGGVLGRGPLDLFGGQFPPSTSPTQAPYVRQRTGIADAVGRQHLAACIADCSKPVDRCAPPARTVLGRASCRAEGAAILWAMGSSPGFFSCSAVTSPGIMEVSTPTRSLGLRKPDQIQTEWTGDLVTEVRKTLLPVIRRMTPTNIAGGGVITVLRPRLPRGACTGKACHWLHDNASSVVMSPSIHARPA
jgi:hypothetical protein